MINETIIMMVASSVALRGMMNIVKMMSHCNVIIISVYCCYRRLVVNSSSDMCGIFAYLNFLTPRSRRGKDCHIFTRC